MKNAKRILIPALAFILTLSLSLGCFAAVTIDYTFTEEINGEEYTFLFGRTDTADVYDEIGVTVNGTEYKVDEDKIDHVKATGRFGMAFKDESNVLASVTPYIKNEGEKIEGEKFDVDKTVALPDANKNTITPDIQYLDTDDRAKVSGADDLEQERLYIHGYTNGYNWINFLKIDLKDINKETIDLTRGITLKLWGVMQGQGDLAFMTIRTFMLPDSFDWDAEALNRVDGNGYNYSYKNKDNPEDYEVYITGKTPITTKVKERNNSEYGEFEINITPAVYHAIKNNEDYAYVILAPDVANVNKTNSASFRYYIEGNEKYDYAPKLEYFEKDLTPSNAEISEITIADMKLTKSDFVDGAYTYYLRAGEAYPLVSAIAEIEGAETTVTQATAETNSATVNVVSKNGKNTKTYTINFVAPETIQLFDGLVLNGFSNALTSSGKENLDDSYYYNLNSSDNKRQSNAHGVVTNTADEYIMIGESKCYNAPMLLQLDLSTLTDIDTSKPVKMNLYYSRDDAGVNKVDVQLYDVTSANITDWSVLSTEYLKDTLYTGYIAGKTPVATKEAFINSSYVNEAYAENADNSIYRAGANVIDVTEFVRNCLKNNITNPVVAVYLDGEGYFRFKYNDSTTSFISYYKDYSYLSNAEISEATVGTEKLTKADFVDGAYNYYIKAGEAYPEVTATPEIEGASATVTQASEDINYATINVVSEDGKNTNTYTITFLEFNYAETITPAISYLGSATSCDKLSKSAYQFAISKYDASITTNFLKIDISSFKNKDYINDKSRFTLNLNAKMQRSPSNTDEKPDSMTVRAFALPNTFNWETETEARANLTNSSVTGENSDYNTYVEGKTPLATTSLPFSNEFENISLDISSVIYNALAVNADYAYVVLAGDIAQKAEFTNTNNIVSYYYAIGKNAPTITLDAYKIGE